MGSSIWAFGEDQSTNHDLKASACKPSCPACVIVLQPLDKASHNDRPGFLQLKRSRDPGEQDLGEDQLRKA